MQTKLLNYPLSSTGDTIKRTPDTETTRTSVLFEHCPNTGGTPILMLNHHLSIGRQISQRICFFPTKRCAPICGLRFKAVRIARKMIKLKKTINNAINRINQIFTRTSGIIGDLGRNGLNSSSDPNMKGLARQP